MGFVKARELTDYEVFGSIKSPIVFGLILGEYIKTGCALVQVEYADTGNWIRTHNDRCFRIFAATLTKENLWQLQDGDEWLNLYLVGNSHEVNNHFYSALVSDAHEYACQVVRRRLAYLFKSAFRIVLYAGCEAFTLEEDRLSRSVMWQ